MAKVIRDKLARGAKLLTKHVFAPASAAQGQLTTTALTAGELSSSYAPFRVNLSIPYLSSHSNRCKSSSAVNEGRPYHAVPFMLPPLQEHLVFSVNTRGEKSAQAVDGSPEIILDEVVFSFDQRLEPAAIVSDWEGGTPLSSDAGKIAYDRGERMKIELAILEKRPTWFDMPGNSRNFMPGRVVWSGTIEGIDVENKYYRLNPWVSESINEVIDPLKTYIFTVGMPNSEGDDATKAPVFVSLEVSMRFLTSLTTRDSGTDIQNIPTRHDGLPNDNLTHAAAGTTGAGINSATSRALIGATPSTGDSIVANDSGSATLGVQTVMAVVDEFSRRKLHGGYKMDSDLPMLEEIRDNAAYTVLAVPLFNNVKWSGMAARHFDAQPYINSAAAGTFAIDRRYIPIEAPMTVHHILFTYNWMRFDSHDAGSTQHHFQVANTIAPSTPTLQLELGVGVGRGVRGDSYGYQQIGQQTILSNPQNASTWWAQANNSAVDLIAHGIPTTLPTATSAGTPGERPWNLELYAMDIVGSLSPSLNGMTAQGKPIFIGRSTSATSARQDINGAPSAVAGEEQWIEVRGRIGDPTNTIADPTHYDANSILLGSGGMWVYIIGKTHLV